MTYYKDYIIHMQGGIGVMPIEYKEKFRELKHLQEWTEQTLIGYYPIYHTAHIFNDVGKLIAVVKTKVAATTKFEPAPDPAPLDNTSIPVGD